MLNHNITRMISTLLRAGLFLALVFSALGATPVQAASVPAWESSAAAGRENNQPTLPEGVAATLVAAGYKHTCVLTTGGGVKCWGSNDNGQLGDGTIIQRNTPVDVTGLTSGFSGIGVGAYHTCALTLSGSVKCWGSNDNGQLGDGTTTVHYTPVDVAGLAGGVSAIAAGAEYTCALTMSGGVKCWGRNNSGQLGNGTFTSSSTPVNVVGLASGVRAITLGAEFACVVTASSGVKCWGAGYNNQFLEGVLTNHPTPVDINGFTEGISAIAAGSSHICALMVSGSVKCWGDNSTGQLGDGTTAPRATTVDVLGLASGVTAIAVGSYHTCALTASGGVKCWGDNTEGELGDGVLAPSPTPLDVAGLPGGVGSIAAGGLHTCALTASNGVKCWGSNEFGQLGNGALTFSLTPVGVSGLASGVSAVAAGWAHTCALTASGGARCWGRNYFGQLGDETNIQRNTPVNVAGLASGVRAITAGENHTCALTVNGGVKCWGLNYAGQLGAYIQEFAAAPVDVIGLTSGVSAIAAGQIHTCALTVSGGVKCWGSNYYGQLGDGTTINRGTPVDVVGLASGVRAIAVGQHHTCALTVSGAVKCWGLNVHGQLGDGTFTSRSTPVSVIYLANVSAISAGGLHTCALTASGGAKCWGLNDTGQLGDHTTTKRSTPVDVVGLASGVNAITAGEYYTCALTVSGAKCWGYNRYGQLGDGTTDTSTTPVSVNGLAESLSALAAGYNHTCVLTMSGGLKCLGNNMYDQLGDGNGGIRLAPVPVSGLLASAFPQIMLSANSSSLGQTLHFAVVFPEANDAPSGTVQFAIDGLDFASPVTLSGGAAVSAGKSDLSSGAHLIQAYYSGDNNFIPASAAGVIQSVDPSAAPTCNLSGNAGVGDAMLSYAGGFTMTDVSGNYTIPVPSGWSGTLTPSKAGYFFAPASRAYTEVTADQTGQDYLSALAPSFAAASQWTTSFDLSHGWTVKDYARTVGDVDGDGKLDLVGFGLNGVYVALSNGSGFDPASQWTTSFDLSHGWTVSDYVRTVGDINGDGKADLIGFGLDGVYVAISNGTGFDDVSRWTTSFDLSHGWTVKDYVRTVGDVNGDGKTDLVGFGLDGVYVALSNGTGFDEVSRWTSSFDLSHGWTVSDYVRTVGDVNADGKADLVGFGLDGVYVALSNGTGFDDVSRWTTAFDLSHGWTVKDYVRTVGDVNADGKADLVGFGLDGVYVALSTGSAFYPVVRATTSFDLSHGWTVKDYARTVGDVNGDGKADLVGFGLDGVYVAISN